MRIGKATCLGLALGGVLLLAPGAQAIPVSYATVGRFTGGEEAGTGRYVDTANGIDIDFQPAINNTVNPPVGVPTSVTFGTFDTAGTTNLNPGATIVSGFELDIIQILPDFGTTQFVATVTGTVTLNFSSAFVQFAGPLSATIPGALPVIYRIASADLNPDTGLNTPGRVNLPNSDPTGNTQSTVVGFVTVVPEPSAIVLMGLGAPAVSILLVRARRKAKATA